MKYTLPKNRAQLMAERSIAFSIVELIQKITNDLLLDSVKDPGKRQKSIKSKVFARLQNQVLFKVDTHGVFKGILVTSNGVLGFWRYSIEWFDVLEECAFYTSKDEARVAFARLKNKEQNENPDNNNSVPED